MISVFTLPTIAISDLVGNTPSASGYVVGAFSGEVSARFVVESAVNFESNPIFYG